MPSIGEIKINDKYQKFIWVACENCGVKRWILIVRGLPRSKVCRSCHGKLSQPNIWKGYHKILYRKGSEVWQMVRTLIKKGIIKRQPCSICSNAKSKAHHPDYTKPLEIVWLCQKHHTREHLKELRG